MWNEKEYLFRKKRLLCLPFWNTIQEHFHYAWGLKKSSIWAKSSENANKTEDF